MPKTGAGTKRQIHWGALIILLAGAVGFGLAIWFRLSMHGGPTALEALIAENAPQENVQALALLSDGNLAVGTSLGVITGSGKRWERLPDFTGDVKAIAPLSARSLLLAGHAHGLVRYVGGTLASYLGGAGWGVVTLGDGSWVVLTEGRLLWASADEGKNWSRLAEFAQGEQVIALAAQGERLAAGGLQGSISESSDGGKSWNSLQAPGGSVTALLYDPSKTSRLWVAAGGGVLYSDDQGQSWRSGKRSSDRQVVALAPAPAGSKSDLVGITADGLLITIGQ